MWIEKLAEGVLQVDVPAFPLATTAGADSTRTADGRSSVRRERIRIHARDGRGRCNGNRQNRKADSGRGRSSPYPQTCSSLQLRGTGTEKRSSVSLKSTRSSECGIRSNALAVQSF